MYTNSLENEIDRLAKLAGYPHIKLSYFQYLKVLTQANENVFGKNYIVRSIFNRA